MFRLGRDSSFYKYFRTCADGMRNKDFPEQMKARQTQLLPPEVKQTLLGTLPNASRSPSMSLDRHRCRRMCHKTRATHRTL